MIGLRVGNDREVAADDAASGPGSGAGTGLVREAAAELYAGDPAGFVQRRGDLAAQARASGEGAAAKAITGLRKPTRLAWVVNRLVHSDPDVPSRLTALGDDLRDAGRSLDGRRLRELSQARRDLIAALTRRALAGAGQRDAPVALQEEVAATLSAAVADPQVAAELAAGTLVRPVERSGFGFGPAQEAGRDGDAGGDAGAPRYVARPAQKRAGPERARDQRAKRAGPDRVGREQAERERAERDAERARAEREQAERERREAITAAEQAAQQAVQAADAAQSAERARAEAVGELERQLEDAQDLLAGAKRRSRAAAAALRDARRALDRLRKSGPA